MNYISHYYLYKEIANAEMSLGLVLPDFSRTAHKKFRLKVFKDLKKTDHFYHLKFGINKHFETDEIFHAADFFKIHVAQIKSQVIDYQIIENNKYAYFLAHIAFEMILDRCLIKQNLPEAYQFYKLIEQVDLELIKAFLLENAFEKYEPELMQFMHNFKTKKYILAYVDDEKMAYSLGRVFSYATKIENEWSKNAKMHELIINTENYLNKFIDDIFNYMKVKLNLLN